VAVKKPKIGADIKFCDHMTFAMLSAITADFVHSIDHQHRRFRQLGIAWAKQLSSGAFQ